MSLPGVSLESLSDDKRLTDRDLGELRSSMSMALYSVVLNTLLSKREWRCCLSDWTYGELLIVF
jgi:hypothetical protein